MGSQVQCTSIPSLSLSPIFLVKEPLIKKIQLLFECFQGQGAYNFTSSMSGISCLKHINSTENSVSYFNELKLVIWDSNKGITRGSFLVTFKFYLDCSSVYMKLCMDLHTQTHTYICTHVHLHTHTSAHTLTHRWVYVKLVRSEPAL